MKKGETKINIVLLLIFIAFIIFTIMFFVNSSITPAYKEETIENTNEAQVEQYDIEKIIEKNTKVNKIEEISESEEDLEFNTIYKVNKELPKGDLQVIQEGRDGKQQIIIKKYYEGETLINEEVETNIIIASVDKIVEIGGANYTSNYNAKVGDKLFVTSNELALKTEPNNKAGKIITINKSASVKLLEINNNWYKVKYNMYEGFVPAECLTYIDPNRKNNQNVNEKTRNEIISNLNKNIDLNKPSGLSLNQFKKVLSNEKNDVNNIFQNNAEYFYYAEKQYNINGIFLAAIAIHESNWGTSKIALSKQNLFGYGAYDTNPYVNAKSFNSYAEGIDLVARVLIKYYLNPSGTSIYNGEMANGKYYNGTTLADVNKKYATDKNWSNGVYNWMSYLCNRL